jgi:outer membrane protein assembly factor BamC
MYSSRFANSFHRSAIAVATSLAVLALSGCSVLQDDKVDYKTAKKGSSLEVPPDLTQLQSDSRYQAPGASVRASEFQGSTAAAASTPTAASVAGDVRIERQGAQRWLVVKRAPQDLWDPVRDFWQDNGFLLETDNKALGIMETDWAENRAKLPQDFIRESLGKLFESLYSTGELDKFRTRMERNDKGETEIYVSHRGMIEVYTSSAQEQTRWQPRDTDAELENEFLRRLMLRLGASNEQAAQAAAQAAPLPKAILVGGAQGPALTMAESFERGWRRVGLALDRTGFTVEDRDRSTGTYFVRYAQEVAIKKDSKGFFSGWFGSGKTETKAEQYRVVVTGDASNSRVRVQDAQGAAANADTAKLILSVLSGDLK